MIEQGANPNVQSPLVSFTPLHWLAYWGDHRAIKELLELNRIEFIQPQGFCVNKQYLIQKHGAFNAFHTANGLTPADIAGDCENIQSLKVIV